jgi:hypothetical protein
LLMPPLRLYRALQPYADPLGFIEGGPTAAMLSEGRREDMTLARRQPAAFELPAGGIYVLPDAPWAHRVQGAFANELATRFPQRAHAVLCELPGHGYSASVRAPVVRPQGADKLCLKFPGGGGRAGAAGIDDLPAERLPEFADAFGEAFAERAEGRHGSDSN